MKGFLKPKFILPFVTVLLLAGAIAIPLLSGSIKHSHAAGSGEPRHPSQPPKVTIRANPATGQSDPVATIMQACPATAPINPTPFKAGDVIIGFAKFTSTDTGEASETEEANNALEVFIKIPPVEVKLNQTTPFTFKAAAGDNLFACFVTYDGDEVGTITYRVMSLPRLNLGEPHEPSSAELREVVRNTPLKLPVVDLRTLGKILKTEGLAKEAFDCTTTDGLTCLKLTLDLLGLENTRIGRAAALLSRADDVAKCIIGIVGAISTAEPVPLVFCVPLARTALEELLAPELVISG